MTLGELQIRLPIHRAHKGPDSWKITGRSQARTQSRVTVLAQHTPATQVEVEVFSQRCQHPDQDVTRQAGITQVGYANADQAQQRSDGLLNADGVEATGNAQNAFRRSGAGRQQRQRI